LPLTEFKLNLFSFKILYVLAFLDICRTIAKIIEENEKMKAIK